jgi:Integral membrane protein TerC family
MRQELGTRADSSRARRRSGQPAPDHLDQHHPLRRQCGGHRDGLWRLAGGQATGRHDPWRGGRCRALRIVFTILIATLLATPFLKIIGGCLLLWIAVKLLTGNGDEEGDVKESDRLWHAVRTVAIADVVMSLDNVLAIAASRRIPLRS